MTLTVEQLTPEDRELIELARCTIDANTDADSGDEDGAHTMGAAVRDVDGRTFVGVNLYHFTGGPCAELVALGAARAAGSRSPQTIVAVGDYGRGVKAPCGRDRQVMYDYYPDIRVILPIGDEIGVVVASALLPGAFDWPK